MKLGLVHDHLNQIGGAERVLLTLTDVYPKAPIHTLLYDPHAIADFFRGCDIRTSFIERLPGGRRWFKWFLPLMPTAFESFDCSPYDVILSSSSALSKGVIAHPHQLHICYCHTPTRYLWSDTHEYLEKLPQRGATRLLLPMLLTRLRMWDYQSAQRVDRFIANSRWVAGRIRKYYGRPSDVIYPPVDTRYFVPSSGEGGYYCIVSRLRPYKKVDLAIEACNRLKLPLVIAGNGEDEARLRALAGPTIAFRGHVSEREKRDLLQNALAFIHPQEEDFGITAVEAMAAGRPVIAFRRGGATETIIENETGMFFDEQSWEGLADALLRFRGHARHWNPKRIHQHAEQFDTSVFREKITRYVEEQWKKFQEGSFIQD
ncbi:glycosyltransferase [Candidatus Uhrbacteria bacterium]|nr:glycosyltransferase [Candidatus Uhrbacteria bacterium]